MISLFESAISDFVLILVKILWSSLKCEIKLSGLAINNSLFIGLIYFVVPAI